IWKSVAAGAAATASRVTRLNVVRPAELPTTKSCALLRLDSLVAVGSGLGTQLAFLAQEDGATRLYTLDGTDRLTLIHPTVSPYTMIANGGDRWFFTLRQDLYSVKNGIATLIERDLSIEAGLFIKRVGSAFYFIREEDKESYPWNPHSLWKTDGTVGGATKISPPNTTLRLYTGPSGNMAVTAEGIFFTGWQGTDPRYSDGGLWLYKP
ncbi:MAG TPA: hypothetical protein VD886_15370, partial [Herpetosiphonaceae bacterium]|nr:hypothetical protein [Herpetosiphonaceae bacterium]